MISRRGMSWDADGTSTKTVLTWSPPATGSKYGDQRHWRPGRCQTADCYITVNPPTGSSGPQRLTSPVCQIDIIQYGVTSLTFQGHVTSCHAVQHLANVSNASSQTQRYFVSRTIYTSRLEQWVMRPSPKSIHNSNSSRTPIFTLSHLI